jgi:hypothetical protein
MGFARKTRPLADGVGEFLQSTRHSHSFGLSISSRVGSDPAPRKARLTVAHPASRSTALMNRSPFAYWLTFISSPVIRKKAAVLLSFRRSFRTLLILDWDLRWSAPILSIT